MKTIKYYLLLIVLFLDVIQVGAKDLPVPGRVPGGGFPKPPGLPIDSYLIYVLLIVGIVYGIWKTMYQVQKISTNKKTSVKFFI